MNEWIKFKITDESIFFLSRTFYYYGNLPQHRWTILKLSGLIIHKTVKQMFGKRK